MMRGSRNAKPLYKGTRIPNAATTIKMTSACRAMSESILCAHALCDKCSGVTGLRIRRQSSAAAHVLRVLLILLADVFHQLFVRTEASGEGQRERLRVVARVDDGDLVLERA